MVASRTGDDETCKNREWECLGEVTVTKVIYNKYQESIKLTMKGYTILVIRHLTYSTEVNIFIMRQNIKKFHIEKTKLLLQLKVDIKDYNRSWT